MADPVVKRATLADLEALPDTVVGELIQGVLYTMARPRPRHQRASGRIFGDVEGRFDHKGGMASTRNHDQRKRPLYARAGVKWMWGVDVDDKTLVVSRNEGGKWLEIGVFGDEDVMQAEPFEVLPIELRDLWA